MILILANDALVNKMKLEDFVNSDRTKQSQGSFKSSSKLSQKASRVLNILKARADYSNSRTVRISCYAGIGAVAAAYLATGYTIRAGEYALNTVADKVGLKALPLKAKAGIAALVITSVIGGGGVLIDNYSSNQPSAKIEAKLPVGSYRLTENDIKIHKNDIFYGLLENNFGYKMHDKNGRYVPLRTTKHHKGNPETFLKAFMRLNPNLYSELRDRERRAKRPGDTVFHHLRPGDVIMFYSNQKNQYTPK